MTKVEETRDKALKVAIDFKKKCNEFAKLSTSIANAKNAYATNSTSCEASILKENVELRAQLDLLTSKYEKLDENHKKLSSSNEILLASHA